MLASNDNNKNNAKTLAKCICTKENQRRRYHREGKMSLVVNIKKLTEIIVVENDAANQK